MNRTYTRWNTQAVASAFYIPWKSAPSFARLKVSMDTDSNRPQNDVLSLDGAQI
jgi:hypothetical protein